MIARIYSDPVKYCLNNISTHCNQCILISWFEGHSVVELVHLEEGVFNIIIIVFFFVVCVLSEGVNCVFGVFSLFLVLGLSEVWNLTVSHEAVDASLSLVHTSDVAAALRGLLQLGGKVLGCLWKVLSCSLQTGILLPLVLVALALEDSGLGSPVFVTLSEVLSGCSSDVEAWVLLDGSKLSVEGLMNDSLVMGSAGVKGSLDANAFWDSGVWRSDVFRVVLISVLDDILSVLRMLGHGLSHS